MAQRLSFLHRLVQFVIREDLHRILFVLVALSVFSALSLWRLEGGTIADWLWWSFVTVTTVGYGDITPSTHIGRIIGALLMCSGIGTLSLLTASIASVFVELRLRKDRGMASFDLQKHIILCQWNDRSEEVLRELRADPRTAKSAIVLVADIESKPVDDELLYFVRGKVTEENLKRAGVEGANTVVILGDDAHDTVTRDAQVVLTTLTVETLNPGAYTIVEVLDEVNVQHCQRARADEVIVAQQLSSLLIASATVDHGLSKVVSELLSQRYGNDLRRMDLPEGFIGRGFLDVFIEVKKSNNSIVVAVQRGDEVITNPASDLKLGAEDHLIAIVDCHPA